MRLRTFTASDMAGAMQQVRAALGDDAIILSTETDRTTRKVTVTAAVEQEEYDTLPPRNASPPRSAARSPSGSASAQQNADWTDELTYLLRYHGTPEALSGRLVYKARHLELHKLFALQKLSPGQSRAPIEEKALSTLLSNCFHFSPLIETRTARLMLVGAPGIGKTLAIAKLAAQMVMDRQRVTVITTDTKRAGGVEQLSAFTDILELALNVAESPQQLAGFLRAAPADAHVFIDTAGCNPYSLEELEELTEFVSIGGFEPLLTLPAGINGDEAADTARAFAFPTLKRLFITRMDSARRLGALLAAADARRLAFAGFNDSARIVGEIKAVEPAYLAARMLQYKLQTA